MDCGLAVITSKTGSLSEVASNAALLVNPENIDEIANAMKKIANDEIFKKDLIQKGFERSKRFSWQKAAQGLLQVLKL
jgi:glycosyltransferase involved in cell wall biosynthesis